MKKAARVLIILSVLIAAGSAVAEEKVIYKQKTIIDFSDVTIQGELTKPEGSYIGSRKEASFNRLIKVRENFDP